MEVINKMGKRLTNQEKRAKEVSKVVSKIKKLEKSSPQDVVESACVQCKNANVNRRKAESEMEELEKKFEDDKRRLK